MANSCFNVTILGMTKRSYIDAVLRGIQQALPFCSNDMKIRYYLLKQFNL